MILGCDAAGIDADGNEVVVHAVDLRATTGAATRRSTRSARCSPSSTRARFAEQRRGARAATSSRSRRSSRFDEAACLPTAWLTAYRMLFTNSGARARARRSSSRARAAASPARAIVLGAAAGLPGLGHEPQRGEARARARSSAPHAAFETGARLPERVDAVMETVGAATWKHSLKRCEPGGDARRRRRDQRRRTRRPSSAASSSCSSGSSARRWARRDELLQLMRFCGERDIEPEIDRVLPMADARDGFAAMAAGEMVGKIVFELD